MRNIQKNKKIKTLLCALPFALSFLMLFSSCENILDIGENTKPKDGYGIVSIILTGENAPLNVRTIFPSSDSIQYSYTFTKEGAATGTALQPDNQGKFTLAVGNYTVKVDAKVSGTMVASGVSAQFTVSKTAAASVNVSLSPAASTGNGTFKYTITAPANASITVTLQKWSDKTDVELTPVNTAQGNGKTQDNLSLATGAYLLTAIAEKGTDSAGINEIIYIYPLLKTEYSKVFIDANLITNRTITNIELKTPPNTMIYDHGDIFDLDGLVVTLTYDTDNDTELTEDITAADFDVYGVTANPAYGSILSRPTNNGNPVTISYGDLTPINIGNLTVNIKDVSTLTIEPIPDQDYTGRAVTPAVTVKNGTTTLALTTDYTVSYSNNTDVGTDTASVTITGVDNYTGTKTANFSIKLPSYGIYLSQTGAYIFPSEVFNTAPTALTVTVTNIGANATGALTIGLTGADPACFTLSKPSITNIAVDGEDTFTIAPVGDLAVKTYAAIVTVSGGNGISQTFNVSFTVTPASFISPPALSLDSGSKKITYTWTASTPSADTYDIYWKEGSGLTAEQVKSGTKITGATSGGKITGLTDGTVYSVIVTANKVNYNGVDSAVLTATPADYIITGSGAAFTATKAGVTIGTANQTIQNVINDIRTHADGDDCSIQFGNGTDVLDIGSYSARFNNSGGTWGLVELKGKITGNITTSTTGTIAIANTVVTSTADITNAAYDTSAIAIYNDYNGAVTISGGRVSATTGRAVYNNGTLTISGGTVSATNSTVSETSGSGTAVYNYSSSGTINISGGTVSATTGTAVYNFLSGSITISGGTVSATTGTAVYNNRSGSITISGGTVSVTTGVAVHNADTGKITVSQAAGAATRVTSANTDTSKGTIFIANSGTDTAVRLEITGGTVENTSTTTGNAIRNDSTGSVSITGGTVSATSGTAVYNNSSGVVTISGGTVSATTGTAVYNNGSGSITISGGTVSATTGVAVYNASTGKITVSQAAGAATRVTSANTNSSEGTIFIANSGTATAVRFEITGGTVENTSTTTGNVIYNASTGAVTISGGTVSVTVTTATAVYNNSSGSITISGGTVSATTGTAVYNNGSGSITISGGTVSATISGSGTVYTTTRAVYNNGTITISGGTVSSTRTAVYNNGTITISGGTVSATVGEAVYNASTGAITISGGTVSSTTNVAVYNASTGKITVSQAAGATTKVTSANNSNSSGTIYIANSGTATAVRLEITGGTVENTSDTTYGNTIRNDSTGSVSITGGTVLRTVRGGLTTGSYALYRGGTGAIIVGSGATIIGDKNW